MGIAYYSAAEFENLLATANKVCEPGEGESGMVLTMVIALKLFIFRSGLP
jgi:hypothetical protein